MVWVIGKKVGLPFSLTPAAINKFRILINRLEGIALEGEVKDFFGDTRHYTSMLKLIVQIRTKFKSLTSQPNKTSLEESQEMKTIFLLIKTLEDLVVRRKNQIIGLKKEHFLKFYQEGQPLIFALKDLIEEYCEVLKEIMEEEHEFMRHLAEIYEAAAAMEGHYTSRGGSKLA